MDEPLGALDELSREGLRFELLSLWERDRISVLFVTHSIREAVLLSDRVFVMGERPGRGSSRSSRFALPRPRGEDVVATRAFGELEGEVRAALVRRGAGGGEGPSIATPPPRRPGRRTSVTRRRWSGPPPPPSSRSPCSSASGRHGCGSVR